jgi:hypothetical protein
MIMKLEIKNILNKVHINFFSLNYYVSYMIGS